MLMLRGVQLSVFKALVLLIGVAVFGAVYLGTLNGLDSIYIPTDLANKINQYTGVGQGNSTVDGPAVTGVVVTAEDHTRTTEMLQKLESTLNDTLSKYDELERDREELKKALELKEQEAEEKEAARAKEEKERKEKEEKKKEEEKKKKEEEKKKKEEEEKKKKEEEKKKKEEEEKRKEEEEKEMEKKAKEEEEERLAPYTERQHRQLEEEFESLKENITFPGFEGPLEPSGKKIVILTASDGKGNFAKHPEMKEMAMASRIEYANYHGYSHQFINFTEIKTEEDDPETKPVWFKFRAIKKTFDLHPEAEWVWWLDDDIFFMTPEIDLAHHVLNKEVLKRRLSYGQALLNEYGKAIGKFYPNKGEVDVDNIDFIVSQDYLGLNAGSFLVRRSDFIFWLLDFIYDPVLIKHDFRLQEQTCLGHLMMHHEEFMKRVGLVPQRLINSYDWVYHSLKTYHDGDLVVHFAGRHFNDDFMDTWDAMWARRKLLPKKYRTAPVKSLNPVRLPDCVKKIEDQFTEEEKKRIMVGGMSLQEVYETFGDRLGKHDIWRLNRYQTYTNEIIKKEEEEERKEKEKEMEMEMEKKKEQQKEEKKQTEEEKEKEEMEMEEELQEEMQEEIQEENNE